VILFALIKEDVVESDKVAVEVREVFDILDVVLMAVGAVTPWTVGTARTRWC
jgi:hypothetical protein